MHAILSLVFDVVTLMDLYLTSVFGFYFVGRLKATRGFFFFIVLKQQSLSVLT